MQDHISLELLELYALSRIVEPQVAAIEEHLLICETCRKHLDEIENFVSAIRWGLKTINKIIAVHETRQGLIHLFTRHAGGVWTGRVLGPELDVGIDAESAHAAESAAIAAFTDMFPEHQCTVNCRHM